jgi:hypothetical protein
MTAPELRPYQVDVIERVRAEIAAGQRRILLVAPTGSGKTVIAAAIIADAVEKGQRALIFAHRHEIVAQTAAKLYAVGIDAGIIQAGFPPRPGQPAQVASIQTPCPGDPRLGDRTAAGRSRHHRRGAPCQGSNLRTGHRRLSERGVYRSDGNAMSQ